MQQQTFKLHLNTSSHLSLFKQLTGKKGFISYHYQEVSLNWHSKSETLHTAITLATIKDSNMRADIGRITSRCCEDMNKSDVILENSYLDIWCKIVHACSLIIQSESAWLIQESVSKLRAKASKSYKIACNHWVLPVTIALYLQLQPCFVEEHWLLFPRNRKSEAMHKNYICSISTRKELFSTFNVLNRSPSGARPSRTDRSK